MTRNSKIIALSLIVLFLTGFASAEAAGASAKSKAAAKPKAESFMKIFYYRDGKNAKASFIKNLKLIDVFAPQTYAVNKEGKLTGKVESSVLALARKNKIKIMPLVTNGSFSQGSAYSLLDDSEMQDVAISALVAEGKKQKFWGWQFDFEGMSASYRDRYSAFIKKAGEALKKNSLVSSVAVVAQISENPTDYQKNLWERVIGVYDYASLASSTDFISLMSYDDPDSKGPVTRYSWLQKVIEHALTLIPGEKISMGIPLYYWKWDDATDKLVDIGGYAGMKNTFRTRKVKFGYDFEEQAPFMTYANKNKSYTLWYENAASIKKKIGLIPKYNLMGFSAWVLGTEHPNAFDSLKK